MKMAKRILSLVLVLAMIACLSVTAFADGTSNTATIVVKASGNAVDTISRIMRIYAEFPEAQREAAAQIGDYYAYLETVGFKIAHYWGFLWGNAFYSQVIPGYAPDSSFTSQYAHMIERDLGIVIQQK